MRVILIFILAAMAVGVQETGFSQDSQSLSTRFRTEKSPLWADGDRLTAYYEGEAESVHIMIGGSPRPLKRVIGSQTWTWSDRFVDLEQGILSYTWDIKPAPKPNKPASYVWRGTRAPSAVALASPLQGTTSKHRMRSEILGTERDITVYMPPKSISPSCVVYAADGEECIYYAAALEPLILEGKVPATAIVGVHCGGYEGGPLKDLSKYDPSKDLRAVEYLPMIDSVRFGKHESFFANEVTKWAESTFGLSSLRERRAVFGVSNGGRFAATIGVDHPEVFGNVIAFSLAVGTPPEPDDLAKVTSQFFFCAGTWESKFLQRTEEFHQSLQKSGIRSELVKRVSGHDLIMWQEEFAHAVNKAFSNEK